MKYCVSFIRKNGNFLQKVDEIIIKYQSNDIIALKDFLNNHLEQRIIISIEDNLTFIKNKELDIFKELKDKYNYSNFALRFNIEENLLYTINDEMRKSGIPYFYNTLATDLDTFTGLINSGASDVYIGGNLGFEIKDISRIAHQRGIKIRVYPNKCQTNWIGTPDIKTFFIRPEDVPSYEPYVDVMEIWAENLVDKNNIDVYYKIYAIDKEWYGDLKEFLIDWNSNLDNRFIIPQFAEARLNCKKRCLKGHPCHVCERIIDISKKLKEGKVIVRYNKNYKASDDNIMIDDNTI